MEEIKIKRQSKFELLRIFAMVMIVAHHLETARRQKKRRNSHVRRAMSKITFFRFLPPDKMTLYNRQMMSS